MTKRMFITVAVVSILSAGTVVATNTFAQDTTSNTVPSVFQEVANNFNLNQDTNTMIHTNWAK